MAYQSGGGQSGGAPGGGWAQHGGGPKDSAVRVALIGAAGAVLAAIVTGAFTIAGVWFQPHPNPNPNPEPTLPPSTPAAFVATSPARTTTPPFTTPAASITTPAASAMTPAASTTTPAASAMTPAASTTTPLPAATFIPVSPTQAAPTSRPTAPPPTLPLAGQWTGSFTDASANIALVQFNISQTGANVHTTIASNGATMMNLDGALRGDRLYLDGTDPSSGCDESFDLKYSTSGGSPSLIGSGQQQGIAANGFSCTYYVTVILGKS